jgi:putative methyltransferase (TIGR04325 family)
MNWHVVDLPEMVKRGRERHAVLGSSMITFGTELAASPSANVMLMLGVIQYLPDPFGEQCVGILETISALPDHILINKIPLTDGPDAWSIQGHVTSAIVCRFFNRKKFIGYFEQHGYRLRDKWIVHELCADIPFNPEHTLRYYEGLYFTRIGVDATRAEPLLSSNKEQSLN